MLVKNLALCLISPFRECSQQVTDLSGLFILTFRWLLLENVILTVISQTANNNRSNQIIRQDVKTSQFRALESEIHLVEIIVDLGTSQHLGDYHPEIPIFQDVQAIQIHSEKQTVLILDAFLTETMPGIYITLCYNYFLFK
jgi:hypothetical protein